MALPTLAATKAVCSLMRRFIFRHDGA